MAHLKTSIQTPSIYALLEKDHTETFRKIDALQAILKNVRYDGRDRLEENLSQLSQLLAGFEKELEAHMKVEEKTFFPFIEKHIPRLEPIVRMVHAEHDDFRESIEKLKKSLQEAKRRGDPLTLVAVYDQGTYLCYLLRSHVWVETHSLYCAADNELNVDEKADLLEKIKSLL